MSSVTMGKNLNTNLAFLQLAPDDYGNTTATAAPLGFLTPTTAVSGQIEVGGDQDWFAVNLTAGQQYTFQEYDATLGSSSLTLYTSSGTQLQTNVGTAGYPVVSYTPTSSGTFYIGVTALGGTTTTGLYTLGVGVNVNGGAANLLAFSPFKDAAFLTVPGGLWMAGDGDDLAVGTAGTDFVQGNNGYDALYGGAGNDFLFGGAQDDIVAGDAGNDTLYGGDGGDVLSELAAGANSGNDLIFGGFGVDIIYAEAGNDIVDGGLDTANNFASLGDGNDDYYGSLGTDVVLGGDGSDLIVGFGGDDALYGEAGSDFIYGGDGIDLIAGAAGNDYLDGGINNDLLVGDDGADTLLGGAGIDYLYGGAGIDIVNGGAGGGVNALYGGADGDIFQVGGAGFGTDYIWDFAVADTLSFSATATVQSTYTASGNTYYQLTNASSVVLVGYTGPVTNIDFTGTF
jgi:Ca2+-binding RTX toxin-like protein